MSFITIISNGSLHQRLGQMLLATLLGLLTSSASLAGIDYQQKADELMPVDCLLPGTVRKLGSQMTYVTPRRPVKTTGTDCEIRGGEYVLYDRASYDSAFAIWMPLAESGDARSQNYVGEIYEKGLGTQPDYAKAAYWYRQAAEQDYSPAQINLGQLYERGLGVEADIEQALSWYRKSANIKGKMLKFVSFDYSEDDILAMQRTIDENASKTDKLNRQIQTLARKLDVANQQKALAENRLKTQERALAKEQQQLAAEKKLLADHQAQVEKTREELKLQLAAQHAEQQAELAKAKQQQLEAQNNEKNNDKKNALINIEIPNMSVKFDKVRLALLKKQLSKQESEASALAASLEEKERQLARQEVSLKKKDLELAELAANYEDIKHQLSSSQQALPAVVETAAKTPTTAVSDEPPTIKMIEPQLLATRGDISIKTRSGVDQRTVIGQVTSNNPLMEVLINDQVVQVDDKGIFQHRIPLTRSKTPVSVVAIDNEGLRADLAFNLEIEKISDEDPQLLVAKNTADNKKPLAKIPDISYGNYHALVIGNSDYKSLPDLETTIADAKAISKVLIDKYGFNVTLLNNATRYDILSALNALRGTLTENDNLLIYYAGHGELDKVNQRGHWLPVDAEAESSANWISNVAITDLLNAMSVRKILVVSDSCYSGAMTRSTLARLDAGRSEQAWVSWLKMNAEQRSRLSLSSGGLAPVLDGGGGRHSIFAKALLDVLESNNTVLEGQQIHGQVARAVNYAAAAVQFDQAPQYAPIRFAGHEAGDFLFVPRKR